MSSESVGSRSLSLFTPSACSPWFEVFPSLQSLFQDGLYGTMCHADLFKSLDVLLELNGIGIFTTLSRGLFVVLRNPGVSIFI